MEGAGYEFKSVENETIAKAAKWISFWSWVAILSGIVMGLGSVFSFNPVGLVMAAVYVVVGVYYRGAASSMQSVVQTAGNDIAHLMTALEKLASAFKVMGILFIVGVVFGLLAGIFGAAATALT